ADEGKDCLSRMLRVPSDLGAAVVERDRAAVAEQHPAADRLPLRPAERVVVFSPAACKRHGTRSPCFSPLQTIKCGSGFHQWCDRKRAADVQEVVNILSALYSRRLRGRRRSLNA